MLIPGKHLCHDDLLTRVKEDEEVDKQIEEVFDDKVSHFKDINLWLYDSITVSLQSKEFPLQATRIRTN